MYWEIDSKTWKTREKNEKLPILNVGLNKATKQRINWGEKIKKKTLKSYWELLNEKSSVLKKTIGKKYNLSKI